VRERAVRLVRDQVDRVEDGLQARMVPMARKHQAALAKVIAPARLTPR